MSDSVADAEVRYCSCEGSEYHVGVNVANIPEAVTYYTQKMGYKEAFRVIDDKGQPATAEFDIKMQQEIDPRLHL